MQEVSNTRTLHCFPPCLFSSALVYFGFIQSVYFFSSCFHVAEVFLKQIGILHGNFDVCRCQLNEGQCLRLDRRGSSALVMSYLFQPRLHVQFHQASRLSPASSVADSNVKLWGILKRGCGAHQFMEKFWGTSPSSTPSNDSDLLAMGAILSAPSF